MGNSASWGPEICLDYFALLSFNRLVGSLQFCQPWHMRVETGRKRGRNRAVRPPRKRCPVRPLFKARNAPRIYINLLFTSTLHQPTRRALCMRVPFSLSLCPAFRQPRINNRPCLAHNSCQKLVVRLRRCVGSRKIVSLLFNVLKILDQGEYVVFGLYHHEFVRFAFHGL
jgi:hypothetical protein